MNGMIVNRKIRNGKIAMKKENEMAAAREVIYPRVNPRIKNTET